MNKREEKRASVKPQSKRRTALIGAQIRRIVVCLAPCDLSINAFSHSVPEVPAGL